MRAIVVRRFGGPEVLEAVDVPVPEPGPGQVRVQVTAAAVNPVDLATRAGILTTAGVIPPREVLGLGWDVAGVVDAVGEPAGFRVGDAVLGLRDRIAAPLGAYAEQIVLDASAVAPAPAGVSPVEAANPAAQRTDGRPGARPRRNHRDAAGHRRGGGGRRACRRPRARPEAERRRRRVRSRRSRRPGIRCGRFVPRGPDLADRVRALVPGGVDAVLDTALLGLDALDAVRGGGEFVAFAAGAAPISLRGIRVRHVWIRADGERLAGLAAAGTLRPRVAGVLPLSRAAEAHERLAAGGLRGRLVLTS
jgi:NADPH:quinone reductase-like Zn-dependent oxidoreductase